jgi:hypothetical protein
MSRAYQLSINYTNLDSFYRRALVDSYTFTR